ncbi:exodeoxyribonuclease VII large subunit [bacterium]|nr:exodeoxyribonuclease VII large subunit [bacterium]
MKLETAFPLIWVEGEISNFHRHQSGHMYFTLKDENSQLRSVMFRSEAQRVPFKMKDGIQVVCKGRINVYEPRGQYQLVTRLMEPKGKGALQLAFEQLKEKLGKEGLFDSQLKKTLPLLPKKVGVVTSPRGAAIVDILRTLERRFARLHILIYPVRVQGEGASDEIVRGIDYLAQLPDIDALIVGRGGGSMEDLWAFNEEKVARTIYQCPIPVISAVGHEVDFTIADFTADIRASTPSAAAELVIEKEQSFMDQIENLEKRMVHHQKYFLQGQKQTVLELLHHKAFQNFKDKIRHLQQRVDELERSAMETMERQRRTMSEWRSRAEFLEEKMGSLLKRTAQDYRGKWNQLSTALHSASPLNILKKGYALCWKNGSQKLIQDIKEVKEKDRVSVSFYKGEFTCLVQKVDPDKSIQSEIEES